MAFTDPKKNIQRLGMREGMYVADFGAGSGHYTFAISKIVGEKGRVYAIDIQRDLLQRLKSHAQAEHRENIEIVHGDFEELGGSKLRDEGVDVVIISNVFFQVERRKTAVEEVRRVLKPGGKVLFIDWTDSFGYMGPRPEDIILPKIVKELFTNANFGEEESFDAGDHHYGIIFKKK